MKQKVGLMLVILLLVKITQAQMFDENLKKLIEKSFEKSASIKILAYKIQDAKTDEQIAKNAYLPKVSANATYTRLNDDIVFPENLQTLLMGTQKLLIKEKIGLGFNSTLPATVPLQEVDPIQKKDIFKVTGNTQVLLYSGNKVPMAVKATQHQAKALNYLTEKEKNKLIVEVTDAYDQLALVLASAKVLAASEKVLDEQSLFVEKAIENGLATPIERQKILLAKERLNIKKLEYTTNKQLLIEKLRELTDEDALVLENLNPTVTPAMLNSNLQTNERVEIKSIDEAIKALDYKQKMEKTDFIPKLAAFGQYEFRKENLSLLEPVWYAGVRLQWNIFDGFTAKENVKKIDLQKKMYLEQKKEIADLQKLGITKANVDLARATQKIKMCNEQLNLANKTYDLVNKQYRNGLTTLTELLNAINDKERSELELINAYYEQRRANIQLQDVKGILSLN